MDIVTFKWSSLNRESQRMIRKESITKYGYSVRRAAPVGKWFNGICNDITITPIYAHNNIDNKYIKDFTITMPREKYVEFYLQWL